MSSQLEESATIVSEPSLQGIILNSPYNVLTANVSSMNSGARASLNNVDSDGLNDPRPRIIDDALLDLLTSRSSLDRESYFTVRRDDTEQNDAADVAFETFDALLLIEV